MPSSSASAAPVAKSLEEHRAFLGDMVRLQLWFVRHWLNEHPQETLAHCLRQRVDILRKTVFNDGPLENTHGQGDFDHPGWRKVEADLAELERQTRGKAPAMFEQQGWRILQPYVEPRAELDFTLPDPLGNFQCGSLRYDLKAKGTPATVWFHIANRVKPYSIFSDPAYLPGCLRAVIRAVRDEVGGEAIATGTWLNSYERWLALFPEQWRENLSPPNDAVSWSFAFWGQFINARGLLNQRHADQLRATGQMPLLPRSSWCGLAELEAHLDRLDAARR